MSLSPNVIILRFCYFLISLFLNVVFEMSLPFSPFFRRSCECLLDVGSRIPKPASFARIVGTTNCRKRIRSKNLEATNRERQVDRELYSTIRQTIINETSEKVRPFLKEVIQIKCDTFWLILDPSLHHVTIDDTL